MMQSMPHSWRMVKIGDLISPVERKGPQAQLSDTFNYIDIAAVDNMSKRVVRNQLLPVMEAPSRARQVVFPGDILVSTVRPGLNAVAMIPHGLSNTICSTGFCVLRSRSNLLLPNYLFYFVTTTPFIQSLVSKQKGGSYPAVTDNDVISVSLPLPPLSEQQRIVEILQEAEEVRRLRADAETKTAELIPAIFFNHFGSGHEQHFRPLHTFAEVVSGVAIGRKTKGPMEKVPYLRVANVQAGYVDLSEVKTTPATEEELQQFSLQDGDVLLTEGGDFDKLGRGCLWEGQVEPCIHQNHVFRVRPIPGKLNSHFFAHYLQSAKAKQYFLRCAKKTTNLASINLTQLKALPVPDISIGDQGRFEQQIQIALDCSMPKGDNLFSALSQSLSAHAFSGQLTADWREVNKDKLVAEANERDAALKETGASVTIQKRTMAEEIAELLQDRTDGIYADLNREQRRLLQEIERMFAGVDYGRYFTADQLAADIKGTLHRHPQRIESHLALFATRGLVIPVSRSRADNIGPAYAACYRLPLPQMRFDEDGKDVVDSDDIRAAMLATHRSLALGRR